jgi:hypothetical protein
MTEEFLVSWKGETLGPFTREEVESRLRSGEITPLHAIRRNGELIDAARWLHSLRPAKSSIVPTPPPELITTPPPPPTASFPTSAPVENLSPEFSGTFGISKPSPNPPPPPPPARFEVVAAPVSAPPPPPPPPQIFSVPNSKSRVAFILLGVFLGWMGIHNFYVGYTGKAVTQLLANLFLFWTVIVPLGIWIWILVEVITVTHDAQGRPFA